jgi:hypothetical protein
VHRSSVCKVCDVLYMGAATCWRCNGLDSCKTEDRAVRNDWFIDADMILRRTPWSAISRALPVDDEIACTAA